MIIIHPIATTRMAAGTLPIMAAITAMDTIITAPITIIVVMPEGLPIPKGGTS